MQVTEPVKAVDADPIGQLKQLLKPDPGAYKPYEQSIHTIFALAIYLPAGHIEQNALPPSIATVPLIQFLQPKLSGVAKALYDPISQGIQLPSLHLYPGKH